MDEESRKQAEEMITEAAQQLDLDDPNAYIERTRIRVYISPRDDWRADAKAWLKGDGVNNQGRVRSNNLPSREVDGLLFRSQPEIHLYRALKAQGVAFAPLPVFLRGGQSYQRIEPDFVVVCGGALMVIEVDGDTVHVETPAEADQRTRIFKHEGALIERVRASECDTPEKAEKCATQLLRTFDKWRTQS